MSQFKHLLCYLFILWIKYWLMWFESLFVFILFIFKKLPNFFGIRVVFWLRWKGLSFCYSDSRQSWCCKRLSNMSYTVPFSACLTRSRTERKDTTQVERGSERGREGGMRDRERDSCMLCLSSFSWVNNEVPWVVWESDCRRDWGEMKRKRESCV